ncbi:PD-(D/E)XK motif protein [Streptomyces chartreusis]|uniref:PD-(D/E)XK motif protein n=1 Tax=Streptomyces chartreusis TaxID=1969 RepID=UPI003869902B|nr:PD-(D/E)XK motif protein [Streptomyces chartreusis]
MTGQNWSDASMRLRELLETLWARLDDQAAASPVDGILSAELRVSTPEGPVRLGRDTDGMRHLLVPIALSERLDDDRRSAGVHLTTRTLLLGDELPVRYADIACRRGDLAGTFTGLVADICARITVESRGTASSQISRALNSWRLLFGSGTQRWTLPRLAGLFAELLVLEELLTRSAHAIQMWLGPLGCPQDFRSTHHAIEVKGTTSAGSRVVRIHGIDQLEEPPNGTLSLAWFRIVESLSPSARTVRDLLDSCRSKLNDPGELDSRLFALGLTPQSGGPMVGKRFVPTEQRWYEVKGTFPRIVPGSFENGFIPTGVAGIEYQIDLDTVSETGDQMVMLDRLGADL